MLRSSLVVLEEPTISPEKSHYQENDTITCAHDKAVDFYAWEVWTVEGSGRVVQEGKRAMNLVIIDEWLRQTNVTIICTVTITVDGKPRKSSKYLLLIPSASASAPG